LVGPAALRRSRALSTVGQLYDAEEPMTLFELQAWLGHFSPVTRTR
jgi:hypothetical protein